MTLPKPSGDFEWVQESWGAALQCRPLAALAPHYFSTRELAMDGTGVRDQESWNVLAGALGVPSEALVRMRQVHGAAVFETAAGDLPPSRDADWPEADIAISCHPSLALCVRTADCVPVLIADQRTGAVAAVHAGWKGTAAGAVMAAVQALQWRCGTEQADILAAIGPSIGPCCYEVGPELAPYFSAHPDAARWFSRDERPRLDLWRATRDQLERAGVPTRQIYVSALCTADHPNLFHSYRRDGKSAGRLVAAIRSSPGKTL
jgi:YfiH family protein